MLPVDPSSPLPLRTRRRPAGRPTLLLAALAALLLAPTAPGCGKDPVDTLFAARESEVGRCLELRGRAEALDEESEQLLKKALSPSRLRGQELAEEAVEARSTHLACVEGLLNAVAGEAEALGLDATALRAAFTAWYDERARRKMR